MNSKVSVDGKTIDVSKITPKLLSEVLHEAGGNEANVATGYHAIEFLLWGQDLNASAAASAGRQGTLQQRYAGNRPYTDFDAKQFTGGHCERRAEFLKAATYLLVADLEEMVANWKGGGEARKAVNQDMKAGQFASE